MISDSEFQGKLNGGKVNGGKVKKQKLIFSYFCSVAACAARKYDQRPPDAQ